MRLCSALLTVAALGASQPAAFHAEVAGHGRPMILIPGLSSSGDTWKGTVQHFKDRYTTHTMTLAGFAGVPAIDNRPLLAAVREQLAAYIQSNHLDKPIVVGHSLGGNVAMDLAATHPELVGPVVIVDSLPFYANVMFRVETLDAAKPMLDGMRAQFATLTREQYDAYVKSHAATQFMVTSPADLDTVTEWGLKSDSKTVYDSMLELYGSDLRPSLGKIASPTLVLGTWAGLHDQTKAYGMNVTKEMVVDTFRQQYQSVPKLHFAMAETSRHFIMFDDPKWFYEQIDAFLTNPAAITADRGFTR